MSSMLEQAIVDAEALKEAARQSAEEKIIEHFSRDIKEAVDTILEQDEMMGMDPMMGGDFPTMAPTMPYSPAPMTPMAPMGGPPAAGEIDIEAEGGKKELGQSIVDQMPYAATTSTREYVSIDLDKLEEVIKYELNEEGQDDTLEEEYDISDDMLEEEEYYMEEDTLEEDGYYLRDEEASVASDQGSRPMWEGLEDEDTLEEMIRNILAEETGDLFEKEGKEEQLAARPGDSDTVEQEDFEGLKAGALAEALYSSLQEQTKLKKEKHTSQKTLKEQKKLNNKVKLLEQQLNKYKEIFPQLKEQLEESSLQNARLHYQNRVLNSISLNERQKDRIVETIMSAKTVEEAKIIYETLQSAVGAHVPTRKPKSLNEVVTKRSSAFIPRREEKREDPFMARMKTLAGIKD